MPELINPVVRQTSGPSEAEFSALLIAGLARVAARIGRGNLADKSERTTRALDKLFAGSIPHGKGLLDFLHADPSALDELLARYGYQLTPIATAGGAEYAALADTADLHSEHADALRDGKRDHNETIRIADKARPVVAHFNSIIGEADRLRGAK